MAVIVANVHFAAIDCKIIAYVKRCFATYIGRFSKHYPVHISLANTYPLKYSYELFLRVSNLSVSKYKRFLLLMCRWEDHWEGQLLPDISLFKNGLMTFALD